MSVPLRILVVEDEPDLAAGLEDDLVMEGYRVTVARDGNAALSTALDEDYAAIVLDVMLPGRDGFEVCRDLRRAGRRVPIIMLTARAQESDKVLGLELGADDYVTKPFSPRELRARVKAAIRRGAGEIPEVYRFGDAEINFTRREVRRGGTVVELTPIEFKMLATFVRRAGHALTREQLLDEVWGPGVYVTDRVVDTHVANLRKKLEPDDDRPRHIVSVRGAGYRFDA